MLKTTILPKVTVSSDEVTRQRTEITLMSYDKNVHQIKIPTDLTASEVVRVLVIFTFPFDESVIQLNGAWVDGHIQFTLPNELRGGRGNVYIEIDIDLTDDRQLTFARYRLQSVVSDIDKVADGAQTVYFELFEDFVNEVADNAQQAKDAIDAQTTGVESHANTSKQSMDSDVNIVHDYGVSAKTAIDAKVNQVEQAKTDALTAIDNDVASVDTYAIDAKSNVDGLVSDATTAIDAKVANVELVKNQALSDIADKQQDVTDTTVQFKADLSDTQTTIDNQVVQANNALNQLDTTLTGLNHKMDLADTTATNVIADATAKGQEVTTKYNEFDVSVTQAGQTIDDILGLADDVQQVSVQLAEKATKNDVGLLSGLLTTAKTSIVNAINELFNSKANKTQPNFETPTLLNGATPWNIYVGFGVRINELGAIEFRGSLSNLTSGVVIANLPTSYRPLYNRAVISQRENHAPFYIQLNANGDLTVYGVSTILSHRHSFDGVVIFK